MLLLTFTIPCTKVYLLSIYSCIYTDSRETDRQIDGHTGRQTGRQTGKQTGKQTHRYIFTYHVYISFICKLFIVCICWGKSTHRLHSLKIFFSIYWIVLLIAREMCVNDSTYLFFPHIPASYSLPLCSPLWNTDSVWWWWLGQPGVRTDAQVGWCGQCHILTPAPCVTVLAYCIMAQWMLAHDILNIT